MKAIWLTDIHLEFVDDRGFGRFMNELAAQHADTVLISGDIATARSVGRFLSRMAETLVIPIYFVLGNHDYYHGSIEAVRKSLSTLVRNSSNLHWLSLGEVVSLSPTTSLVGHDGWCDARLGDYHGSRVMLNDFLLISELAGLSRGALLQRLHRLGDEAAEGLRAVLPEALKRAKHVVVLTHVPPFKEASWYDGRYSAPDWMPFFSCKAVGDVLLDTMQHNPDKRMTVLCGHTHGGGTSEILPNLVTITGPARYRFPAIQQVFEWS